MKLTLDGEDLEASGSGPDPFFDEEEDGPSMQPSDNAARQTTRARRPALAAWAPRTRELAR